MLDIFLFSHEIKFFTLAISRNTYIETVLVTYFAFYLKVT